MRVLQKSIGKQCIKCGKVVAVKVSEKSNRTIYARCVDCGTLASFTND